MSIVADPNADDFQRLERKIRRLQISVWTLAALILSGIALRLAGVSVGPAELIAQRITIVDAHGATRGWIGSANGDASLQLFDSRGNPWLEASSDEAQSGRREIVIRDGNGRRRAALGVIAEPEVAGDAVEAGTVTFGLFSGQEPDEGDGISMVAMSVAPSGEPSLSLSIRNYAARLGMEVSSEAGGAGIVGTDLEGRATLRLPEASPRND